MTTLVNIHHVANFPKQQQGLDVADSYPDTYTRNRMMYQQLHTGRDWDPWSTVPVASTHADHQQRHVFDRERTARPTATWLNETLSGRNHTQYVPVAPQTRVMYGDTADSILLYQPPSSRSTKPLW